jgi:hypothetical protein
MLYDFDVPLSTAHSFCSLVVDAEELLRNGIQGDDRALENLLHSLKYDRRELVVPNVDIAKGIRTLIAIVYVLECFDMSD